MPYLLHVNRHARFLVSDDDIGAQRQAIVDALRRGGDFVTFPRDGREPVEVLVTTDTSITIERLPSPDAPSDGPTTADSAPADYGVVDDL